MGNTLKELNVKPGDVVRLANLGPDLVSVVSGGKYVMDDGQWYVGDTPNWTIVSRATPEIDLTAITTPLGLLDDATREALKAHGGPYRFWNYETAEWCDDFGTAWHDGDIYSVKPSPKVETVELYGENYAFEAYHGTEDTHRITFSMIDGEPDTSSIKMETLE